MLSINISGPDKAGKGYLIAAITRKLEEIGCEVLVQHATTHNAPKMEKLDEEIATRLNGVKIHITEMQTA